ncbi:hypothetical protein GCM10011529_04800 [Polymorphobacter glacialis]|uniref:Uncharacterized protein n=1 Tax=Sandarakinorhabdus glacialis TaxID=1614636 RepID=A0A916ZJR0_9SPHN|nr:hypothetical protein [Polymorphobacter glacialis]GGE01501.1 hypothetical protein GCM10011529_04800 [Polymorphobacter glacialis]
MFQVKFGDGADKRITMVWEEPAPLMAPSAADLATDARASDVLFIVLDRACADLAAQSKSAGTAS